MSTSSAGHELGEELQRIEQLPAEERASAYGALHARFADALERAGNPAAHELLFEDDDLLGEHDDGT